MGTCGAEDGEGNSSLRSAGTYLERRQLVERSEAEDILHIRGVSAGMGGPGVAVWRDTEEEAATMECENASQIDGYETVEDWGAAVRAQHRNPEVDLVGILTSRRLKWLGHVLRMPDTKLIRRVMMRHEAPYEEGSILADEAVPEHASLEELAELAGNHETEAGKRKCADWGVMCAALTGKSGQALPVNTEEETRSALAEIREPALRCYTDGGCDGNGAGGLWGSAGWGAHILAVSADGETERVEADLWGPVETNPGSPWWCGAPRGTNNTGELTGIGQALIWLRDIDKTNRPAAMLYDSGYAANMVAGRWQPNSNQFLVQWARGLLAQVEENRKVIWVHVKGHSGDGGNDRADELVQWGKEEGPYARLRAIGEGEGESRFGAADKTRGSEKRTEKLGSGELQRGHK
eukprot:SAG11_NODE_3128_length_2665_cov_1.692518_3_plen_407_part_00